MTNSAHRGADGSRQWFPKKRQRGAPAVVGESTSDDPEPCPVRVLGNAGGHYYFLTPDGQFRELPAHALDRAGIMSLFGQRIPWLWNRWPRYDKSGATVVGWQIQAAQEYLITEADKAGLFSPSRVIRGPGVWRTSEGLIVHCGDAVLVGGIWRPAGVRIGDHIYRVGQRETRPADAPASEGEIAEVFDFLQSWNWRAPVHAPRLLLGWIGAASIAGALTWRPHIQLTGDKGSGKSTLVELVKALLGSTVISVSAPTEAGIRQLLEGAARPVLVDEIETDNMDRARRVIELVRLASTEGQAPVPRGGVNGRATQWPVRACFMLSSILHVKFRGQDLSRICVLELDALPAGERSDGELPQAWARRETSRLGAIGPALRRRMIDSYPRLLHNIAVYEGAVIAQGQRARVADQLGILLACAETLISDAPVTPERAAKLVADFIIPDITGHDEEDDHASFIQHLLSSSVAVSFDRGGQRFSTIGELVRRTDGGKLATYNGELRQHGLAVMTDLPGDPPPKAGPHLAIAYTHQGLAVLLGGTRWADGTWKQAAMRLPFACQAGPVSFAGIKQRAVWVPIESLPLEDVET
jgi:hypothetical protein